MRGTTFTLLAVMCLSAPVRAAAPTADEMLESAGWAAARFAGRAGDAPISPGLTVLANNDSPQKDRGNGGPLRIGKERYAKGIFCHAASRIAVRLPGPGAAFTAAAGVDTNPQTSGGRGSIVFVVRVGDGEAFRSAVVREGAAPLVLRTAP